MTQRVTLPALRTATSRLAGIVSIGLLAALGSCASAPLPAEGAGVAVYSPGVRPGAPGRLVFLPASPRSAAVGTTVRGAPLEKPDPSPTEPTSAWLAGIWLIEATRDDLTRDRCNSDAPVAFDADGTLRFSEGKGRWRLRGRTFVETITEVFENAGPDLRRAIGRPKRSTIRRVGPNEGVVLADGAWQSILRCRSGDTK